MPAFPGAHGKKVSCAPRAFNPIPFLSIATIRRLRDLAQIGCSVPVNLEQHVVVPSLRAHARDAEGPCERELIAYLSAGVLFVGSPGASLGCD